MTSPKLSKNFLVEDLVVARKGGHVVEAALHLHHAVVSFCVLLVIKEEEASCHVGVDEVDVKDLEAEAREA